MTPKEFQKRKDAIVEEIYESHGGDQYLHTLSAKEAQSLIVPGVAARMKAECENSPEFRDAWLHDLAQNDVASFLNDHRPTGAYRTDGYLQTGRPHLRRHASRDSNSPARLGTT
jgi:hypothetical protein